MQRGVDPSASKNPIFKDDFHNSHIRTWTLSEHCPRFRPALYFGETLYNTGIAFTLFTTGISNTRSLRPATLILGISIIAS